MSDINKMSMSRSIKDKIKSDINKISMSSSLKDKIKA